MLLAIYVIEQIAGLLPLTTNLLSAQSGLPESDRIYGGRLIVMLCVLAPVGAILAHLLLSTLYVAFRYTDFQDDADREWLGRLSAGSVFPTLLWAIFAATCLLLPWAIIDQHSLPTWLHWAQGTGKWITGLVGAVSGLVAVIGGQSPSAKLDLVATPVEKRSALSFEIIVKVATFIFIGLLLMWFARLERFMAEAGADFFLKSTDLAASDMLAAHLLLLAALLLFLVLTFFAGWPRSVT